MKKHVAFWILLHVALSPSFAQKKPLVFATYAYSTNNRLQNLEPLVKYLSHKTGYTVIAKSYPTVKQLSEAILNDSVQFAMFNTSGYLLLQRHNPGRAIPLQSLDMGAAATTNYGGCLIAKKESNIRSLQDLAQTNTRLSLGLVNSSSTSGNLVPRLLLNSVGIANASDVFAISYSGTHKAVVDDVLSGKITVGGCGCAEVDSARKYASFDSKAVVIDSFNDIPLGPVVYNKGVDKKVIKNIDQALATLALDDFAAFDIFRQGWTEFRGAIGFKRISDEDYNKFRQLFGDNQLLWKMIE